MIGFYGRSLTATGLPAESGGNEHMNLNSRFNFHHAFDRCVVIRATYMALIVGTILALINHGVCIVHGKFGLTCLFQTVLTFMVPYFVSTVSSVLAISDSDRQSIGESTTSPKPPSS